MSNYNASNLIQLFRDGVIINYSVAEYAALRRTSVKVLCAERNRGEGPEFIRNGRRIFYPCETALKSVGIEVTNEQSQN